MQAGPGRPDKHQLLCACRWQRLADCPVLALGACRRFVGFSSENTGSFSVNHSNDILDQVTNYERPKNRKQTRALTFIQMMCIGWYVAFELCSRSDCSHLYNVCGHAWDDNLETAWQSFKQQKCARAFKRYFMTPCKWSVALTPLFKFSA